MKALKKAEIIYDLIMNERCVDKLVIELIDELAEIENSTCNWYQDEEYSSDFSSDCGVQFTFNEGMPSENYMKFCCKCGKKLIEHKYDVDGKYKKGKSMTRDTAKEEWSKIIESGIINFNEKNLIDKIYDDFENRSCENCKFKYVVDSMCTECRCNESPIDYIDFDCFPFFSCSEWEPK